MARKIKRKRKHFSTLEKKAYYTGMGVGFTGEGPSSGHITSKAFRMMSEKERISYINGYEKGLDNPAVLAGIRNRKKWFFN